MSALAPPERSTSRGISPPAALHGLPEPPISQRNGTDRLPPAAAPTPARATSAEEVRRDALAQFLRARRESLQPEDIGVPRRGRRRVKGLRRHEVADAAAVSVTWYTWLEQGRDIHTTPQVIEALARALQLDDSGHSHLRRLAGVTPTACRVNGSSVGEALITLVDSLLPNPAQLMLPTTDLITWNRAYSCLFMNPSSLPAEDRNAMWIQLMHPEVARRVDGWENETRLAVGRFRAEAAKYPGDPDFARVIARLTDNSEFFRRTWPRHEVQDFTDQAITITHPEVGGVRVRLLQLRPLDRPDLLLNVHMLDDDVSRERLSQLLDR